MLQRDRAVVIDCETTITADAKADSTRDAPALMADLRLRCPRSPAYGGFSAACLREFKPAMLLWLFIGLNPLRPCGDRPKAMPRAAPLGPKARR